MKDSLPSQLLNEKLPRFLQKCAQTFESDRRYRNDLRYLRVWLQLMDFVDDPRVLLRTMEVNHIGKKRSLFYQAYALYYEKIKKFEEAEKMYHLGVQNLAEPVDELQKSYEQFLHRLERYKNKRTQMSCSTRKEELPRGRCLLATFLPMAVKLKKTRKIYGESRAGLQEAGMTEIYLEHYLMINLLRNLLERLDLEVSLSNK